MTEKQELKMQLLEKFGINDEPQTVDYCRRAYEFLTEGEEKPQAQAGAVSTLKPVAADGVYIVYTDGSIEPYTGKNDDIDKEVKGIGVRMGSHAVVVALRDCYNGEETELTTQKDPAGLTGNYLDNVPDAVTDYDGVFNTDHLCHVGLSPNIQLANGEYIPALGEMHLIYLNLKAINKALEFVGGEPIARDWYWTSTEYSATHAWYLYLNRGYASNNPKASGTIRVRPVSAFIS